MGTLSVLFQVSYNPLFVALVPRERFVEGGSIMHGSRALSYVAGPSIGGLLVQAYHGARDARRRRLLVPRLSPLPAERRGRGACARGAGRGPCRRRHPVGVRERDRPGRARRDSDDQLLQLRLLRALHPLRHELTRRPSRGRSGSCSGRAPSAASSARSSPAVSPGGSGSGRRSRSAASSSPRPWCSCRSPRGRAG